MSKLERAKALLDAGALSPEEFESEKAQLLPNSSPIYIESSGHGCQEDELAPRFGWLKTGIAVLLVIVVAAIGYFLLISRSPISSTDPAQKTALQAEAPPLAATPAPVTPSSAPALRNESDYSQPSATPTSFPKPILPTPIEQTQCHMGECTWEQITSVADVSVQGNEVLRKAVTRTTDTTTPDGQDYPAILLPGPHDWTTRTAYFLCSLSRPAAIDRDDDAKDWMVTQLTVVSPFGYEVSAVADYKRVCHGVKPGSNLDQHPDKLGYVDRNNVSQPHIQKPIDIFK